MAAKVDTTAIGAMVMGQRWKYTYVDQYGYSGQDTVPSNIANLASLNNTTWDKLVTDKNPNPKDTKLIFLTRHGQSVHNVKAKLYDKSIYYELLAHDPKDIDPKLSDAGRTDAMQLGHAMKVGNHPRPTSYYSSPLRRCVSTAISASKALYGSPKPIHVKEGLREWMGWDNNHSSDRRSTRAQLKQYAMQDGGEVDFEDGFTEQDPMAGRQEVHVNVQLRIERTLDDIFEDDAHVVHLFLHGRCSRSFLNAIEHPDLKLDNCATMAFNIQRKPLGDKEKLQKRSELTKLAEKELKVILGDNNKLAIKARELVKEMSKDEARELWKLLTDEAKYKWKSWGCKAPAS